LQATLLITSTPIGKTLVKQEIQTHEFENGLVLVAQSMPWLESAAFALLVPSGCSRDPADQPGLGNFLCEMIQRGCGTRDSRQFVEDLELLGADTSASVSNAHMSFSGAMPAESLFEALEIYSDLIASPHLPADQLEDSRLVCLQEIRSIEDDLASRAMNELRARHYGDPYGRASQGTVAAIEGIGLDEIRRHWEVVFQPKGAILSVAGKVDWEPLRERVEQCFESWQPSVPAALSETPGSGKYYHISHESSQTHLAIAYPSVPYPHKDYFQARGAVGVLSDGMSSRLFTEVRENRGLCYTVQATCHSLRDRGSVICYAGTTTERAQETLEVMISELKQLSEGVRADELGRLKSRIKSSLIMQQESSTARSGAIAADWYFLKHIRTLDEIGAILDRLSCDSINQYLTAHPPSDFTVVTLGEKQLEMPSGVS
jgi:predicted Zn-dependent peptidase